MKKQILLFLGLIFSASLLTAAQTKTVTNADLEKYRQQRLAAEREYRENYRELGFPSPEELEKQIKQSRIEREALSEKLRAERLERERFLQEQRQTEILLEQNQYLRSLAAGSGGGTDVYVTPGYPAYGYYGAYPNYYRNRRYSRAKFGLYIGPPRFTRPRQFSVGGNFRYVHENSFIRVERPRDYPRFGGKRFK